jgi:hypothetical protein
MTKEEFQQALAAAQKGDAGSQFKLGRYYLYLMGTGTEADYQQAVFWLKKAAGSKEVKFGANWELMLAETLLPARNFRELMEGAQKGNANFQYGLGFAYLKGLGTKIDSKQAEFWFQKAASQRHAEAAQVLGQVKEKIEKGELNFTDVMPIKAGAQAIRANGLKWLAIPLAVTNGIVSSGIGKSAAYYNSAIIMNIVFILTVAKEIVGPILGIIFLHRRKLSRIVSVVVFLLYCIGVIGLSAHYIKGRKTENPVSIILQNPFEAARKYVFGASTVEPVETPVIVTATVTSDAANIRSAPDSGKNNVIIQIKKGGILTVTGPVENDWLPVEVDGKPGYVSANLVRINDR